MDQTYKKHFIRAGALAREVRAFGRSLIKKGASYTDVLAKINQKILELGAVPAFPPQIALNEVAAHFLLPPQQDLLFSDEVVKLDIGVCYKGAIGDCAVTIDLSDRHQKLVDAAEAALLEAEKIIKVGLPIREIGKVIEETISSYGFQPVRNLCGHGLGLYKVHTAPTIPNYDDHSKAVIKPGMTFAIEPFATDGKGMIYEEGDPMIFSFLAPRLLRSERVRSLMAKIRTFKGLPFAFHDLMDANTSADTVKSGLDELLHIGAIAGYGPLIEEKQGMVAQAENSILVDERGQVTVTTR